MKCSSYGSGWEIEEGITDSQDDWSDCQGEAADAAGAAETGDAESDDAESDVKFGFLLDRLSKEGKAKAAQIGEAAKKQIQDKYIADLTAIKKGGFVLVKLGGIYWRVLDVKDDMVLLITEDIIGQRPYNKGGCDFNTWERCTIRHFLNKVFYNKFGEVKSAIADTIVSNPIPPHNPFLHGKIGGDTTD